MIRIACVWKTGGEYTAAHVTALAEQCRRFMPPHRFVCLTDGGAEGIEVIPLQQPTWRGWWAKLELFGPALDDAPTLFLDLDTMLVGDAGQIIEAIRGAPFAILRDVCRGPRDPLAMQSSVMWWSTPQRQIHEAFAADAEAIMGRLRGDQDHIECVMRGKAAYLQDLTPGFASYKAGVLRGGLLPSDRIIFFHGRPRPWEQTVLPWPARARLVLRKGWVTPANDAKCMPAVLRRIGDLDAMILRCERRLRTAVQAGGNLGIWPARMATAFRRVITFEPDPANFAAMQINLGDLPNVEMHHAGLGRGAGRAEVAVCAPDNIGAHFLRPGDAVHVMSLDSLHLDDVDLLQLDVEGGEHDALLGAEQTVKRCAPVISVELKGLGRRFGHSDADTIGLLKSWGYVETGRRSRDVIFQHRPRVDKAVQLANMPAHPPVQPEETCVLVGNGPSVLEGRKGRLIDSFDQVVRFNNFKIRGFEAHAGTRTTLWATFGRGSLPSDDDIRPERVIYLHDHRGDPAIEAKELWRIPLEFFWRAVEPFEGETSTTGHRLLPSSGYLVAAWLLGCIGVKKLALVGFDHFSKEKSGLHHYWINKNYKKPVEHDGFREAEIFARWRAEGKVEYL